MFYIKDEKIYYVYVWIRNDTNKVFYVGKGKKNRINDLSMRNKYFLNVVNKVGIDNTTRKKIEENLTEQEAFDLEIYYIQHYKEIGCELTNMTKGGEGSSDWFEHLSEEEKDKHREISKSFLGRKHTEETKEKIRQSHSRKDFKTKEGKQRLSEFAKSRPVWFKGHHHTEETKEILRQQHMGKLGANAKTVYIIDKNKNIIEKIRSRSETFNKYNNFTESQIRKCLEYNAKNNDILYLKNIDFTFIYEKDYLTKPLSTIETDV